MKKVIFLFLLFGLLYISPARSDSTPLKKLCRGVVNLVTAPVEIPKQARAYWIEGAQKTDHILVWIGSGVGWGVIQGIKRTGSGLWDVVSFPVESPKNFTSLMKPEFVFNEWPRNPETGR